jgi:lambda family phage tail tape measure protein
MADISTIVLKVDATTANVTINNVHNQIQGLDSDLGKLKSSIEALAAPLQLITGLFTAWGAIHIIESLADTADEYTNVGNRIRQTVTNQQDYNTAMANVLQTANDTRTSLEATAELYQKVARGVQGLGGSIQDTNVVTKALSEVMQMSGNSGQQLQGALRQLGDLFNTGQLKGQHFLALMNDAPQVLDVVAKSLGVPVSKLHDLATNGELTAQALVDAFKKAAPEIQKQFDALPMTFSGALQTLKNDWETFVGKFSQESGLGAYAQAFIKTIADMVMGVGNNTLEYSKQVGSEIITVFETTLMTAARLVDGISTLTQKAGNLNENVSKSNAATPVDLLLQAFGSSTADIQKKLHIPEGGLISLLVAGPDGKPQTAIHTAQDTIKQIIDSAREGQKQLMDNLKGANPASFGGANIPTIVPNIDDKTFKEYENALISMTKQFLPLTSATLEYQKREDELEKIIAAGPLLWNKLKISREELLAIQTKMHDAYVREQDVVSLAIVPIKQQSDALDQDKNVRAAWLATKQKEYEWTVKNIPVTQQQLDLYRQTIQTLQDKQKTDQFRQALKDQSEQLIVQAQTYGLVGDQQKKATAIAQLMWQEQRDGIKDVSGDIQNYSNLWDQVQAKMKAASTATLGLQQSFYDYVQKAQDVAASTKSAMDTVLSSLEDHLTQFFQTGKFGFTDLVNTIISEFDRIAARNLIGAVVSAFGYGSSVVTGHAGGGSVNAGQTYWVGENGPELFTAGSNGYINTNYDSRRMTSGDSQAAPSFSFGDIHITNANNALSDAETVKYLVNSVHDKVVQTVVKQTGYGGVVRSN